MNNNLAISSPKWREMKLPEIIYFPFSPKYRQSGEKNNFVIPTQNEGITEGLIEGINSKSTV